MNEVETVAKTYWVWPFSTSGLSRPTDRALLLGPNYKGRARKRVTAVTPGEAAFRFARKFLTTRVTRRLHTYVWVRAAREEARRFRVVVEMVPEVRVELVHPDTPW